MTVAAWIIIGVFVAVSAALVIGLFVWAAVKDGQKDRALQAHLGIRRRTRMGR